MVKATETIVAPNTTGSIAKPKSNAELANETKAALAKMKSGKEVKVSIPAALQPQLGPNLFLCVNNVALHVPVDGEDHSVPEPHAKQLKEYLKNLK